MEGDHIDAPTVSVAVVGICGPRHAERCLDALARQLGAPPFEVVMVYDPALRDMTSLASRFPEVAFFANEGQSTPLELASMALQRSRGDVILLTEDHCIPDARWVESLLAALEDESAATGGVVQTPDNVSPTDWAFYFVDFFRYAPPVVDGPSPSLTVCNVAYRRKDLERIDPSWKAFFHETAVNSELRSMFGPLKISGSALVTMRRHVGLPGALRERWVFGRLFGCTRLQRTRGAMRLVYILGSPFLPVLLIARMASKAVTDRRLLIRFVRSFFPLLGLVLAWSAGEFIGYLTQRRPRDLTVAQEIE